MRRSDELHAAFSNSTRRRSFEFTPDLIDDDHFGIMIFNRFDHHFMLKRWHSDLHAARLADGRMRHIAITADFIRRIHDDHAF